ncbi:MAG TPA: carboxypeptidase-like regulatory domain-containing protein, partial [Gemmatimonadaceae bacterium]|nr:carboxypeptidase-like regulatory domain-containing protein [Gemmatimonadaceae bacterium]
MPDKSGSYIMWRAWTLAVALAAFSRATAAQTRPDSVRGRVTSDSGAVISGADVIITVAPTTNTVRQTTDSAGRYALAIPDGTGEYILYIGATGRKPFRVRLTRTGKDSTFVVDAKLASSITTVATVRVAARKPHPTASLNGDGTTGTSGNDKTVDGVNGALPPDLANNVDAMATLIPGLAVGSGGISAFGMSSDANNTTLNGMNFSGGDLPRDLRTSTRFQTSPWDPTIGGAAGANISQSISGGANIASRSAHLTFDDPSLQFSDPIASHIGQEYSNISLSEGGSGAYALDQLYYSYGLQLTRRTASVASLNALDAAALSLSGVSRDSAAKLLQTLGALHVPVSAGVAPRLTTTGLSFAERIDHRLPTIPQGSTPLPSWSLTALGSYRSADPTSLSPSAISTLAGTNTNASGMLLGSYVRYLGKDGGYLNELSSAISYSENRGTPYLSLPGGNVLISSVLA